MATILGTAITNVKDSTQAGKTVASQALEKLLGKPPKLCLVFLSVCYDIPAVLEGIKKVIGFDTKIIGCSSAGEFTEQEVSSKSLCIGLIASDNYEFEVHTATGLKEDIETTFQTLKQKFKPFLQKEGKTSAFMLIDGLAGNGEEASLMAMAAFETEIKIVGGAAGDDLAFEKTFVFSNNNLLSNAVAICLVKGPKPFFTGVQHGHKPLSEILEVSNSKDNVLYEINGQPAWPLWKEKIRNEAKTIGINVDDLKDATEIGVCLIRFEMGIETIEGYKIRVPFSVNDDGSINFACSVPEGANFRIMKSIKQDQITSATKTAQIALAELGNNQLA